MVNWIPNTTIKDRESQTKRRKPSPLSSCLLFLMDIIASPRVCRLRLRKDSLRAAGNEYRSKHEKGQEERETGRKNKTKRNRNK